MFGLPKIALYAIAAVVVLGLLTGFKLQYDHNIRMNERLLLDRAQLEQIVKEKGELEAKLTKLSAITNAMTEQVLKINLKVDTDLQKQIDALKKAKGHDSGSSEVLKKAVEQLK